MLTVESPGTEFSVEKWIAAALLDERVPDEFLLEAAHEQIGKAALEIGVAALLRHSLSRHPS